jgi:glyceraldehyde-3-phosphate dehydrogenase (ferredoxin)
MKFKFTDDAAGFDLVAGSALNAQYAMAVIDAILFNPKAALFRRGIRIAARELDAEYGINTTDRAVFSSHGEDGCMVPNQYWVPGMLSPMPMMGKYFCYYGEDFIGPYQLGRKNVERMTFELFNENSGICRFHRKWAETITDEILNAHHGLSIDYKAHQFTLAEHIFESEDDKVIPWETERIGDMILGYLEHWKEAGLADPDLKKWLDRFHTNKQEAAMAYWEEIHQGIRDAFADGPEVIPNMLTPEQGKTK